MDVGEHVAVGVDVGQGEIAQQPVPGVPGVRPGLMEVVEQERASTVSTEIRHDAPDPAPGVAAQRRRRTMRPAAPHPRTEQQIARQHEEDRHTDLQSQ